ncbi:MAG: hypothetical protein FWE10_08290 [Rikenellaceae bacterium]|nr:hypothetical protein [Rikenellaceae bacterium]
MAIMLPLMMSCKEDELLTYDSATNVFFPNTMYENWSMRISMPWDGRMLESPEVPAPAGGVTGTTNFNQIVTRQEIAVIPVRIMGNTSTQRRDVAYRILTAQELLDEFERELSSWMTPEYLERLTPEELAELEEWIEDEQARIPAETAEEGVDFEILDAYITANGRDGGILVALYSVNLQSDNVKRINFELVPNENFETNFFRFPYWSGASVMVSTLRVQLSFTDGLTMPQFWAAGWSAIMGNWSTLKIRVLANEFGMSTGNDFLYLFPPPDGTLIFAYAAALQRWLLDYEAEHGEPFLDLNGQRMRLGTSVESLFGLSY